MWFWIRHLLLAALLLLLAALVMLKPEWLVIQPKNLAEKGNEAVQGFTSFYSTIRDSMNSQSEGSEDFVIELHDDHSQLISLLKGRAERVEALPENWQGRRTDRRFRVGDTLKTNLTMEGRKEGVELYWVLGRDYKVKHYFQTDFSYLSAIREAASALSSDFEDPVQAYFCHKSRAVVLTDKAVPYLQQSCINIQGPKRRVAVFN
ncbi:MULTISPECIES: TcpQ domain-containing protein [Rheinheimera]|uniref:TcpQ domain-containing protein n=1 Tax=Rheinheimera marina TaxID=1774958 RepID=A0ABV9JSF6_9GAMM